MSWIDRLASFAKQVLLLQSQVDHNTEEIQALREDVKRLIGFTQKVAYAVKRNEERRADQHTILVQDIKLELAQLERNLSGRGAPLQIIKGGQSSPSRADESDEQSSS